MEIPYLKVIKAAPFQIDYDCLVGIDQVDNYIEQHQSSMESSQLQKSKQAERVEQPTSSSKKKYESVWKVGFIIVLAVGAVLFNKVYIFQTHPEFQGIREGNLTQMLLYGLPFAFIFTLFDFWVHHVFDPLCLKYYITEERYTEPQSRKKRTYTLVKWGYSILYYLITSIWCYKILCGTRFMPTWFGGKGSPYILIQQGPKVLDVTFQMKVFYIAQFGKHFARFFGHVFIRPEGNFFEYALHHGLSVFLIVFSYLTNQWLIGIFVLLVHDYSDFALIMARAYKDYKHYSKKLLDFIYVHAFIAWCGCRIFLFVSVCIYPAFISVLQMSKNHSATFTDFQFGVLQLPYYFMVFMMAGLEVLHIFWTYYIAQSFVSVKISSKVARHSYD